jgi:hypothetical protein
LLVYDRQSSIASMLSCNYKALQGGLRVSANSQLHLRLGRAPPSCL